MYCGLEPIDGTETTCERSNMSPAEKYVAMAKTLKAAQRTGVAKVLVELANDAPVDTLRAGASLMSFVSEMTKIFPDSNFTKFVSALME